MPLALTWRGFVRMGGNSAREVLGRLTVAAQEPVAGTLPSVQPQASASLRAGPRVRPALSAPRWLPALPCFPSGLLSTPLEGCPWPGPPCPATV